VLGEVVQIIELDGAWQRLLRIAHENQQTRATYDKALQEIRQCLVEVTLGGTSRTRTNGDFRP
jgi:hypothetical protein